MSVAQYDPPPSRTDLRAMRAGERDAAHRELIELALRRFHRLSALTDAEKDFVRTSLGVSTDQRVGADLGDDGDVSCRILLSGWACRVSETPWGGRQILDFLVPGDSVGLSVRPRLDGLYRVVALSRSVTVDARALRETLRVEGLDHAGLKRACIEEERATATRMVGHTTRLGGASATQAMAHLLLELRGRLAQVGLLIGDRFPMPLSQENLHEALGITVTQVYRVLTQMRRDGLIRLGSGWAEIADPSALATAAGLKQWRG